MFIYSVFMLVAADVKVFCVHLIGYSVLLLWDLLQ